MFSRVLNSVCFWLLAALACVLFFIAVILPPYKEFRRHQQVEIEMRDAVIRMESQLADNQKKLDLLRSGDPLMQRRLREEIFNDDPVAGRVMDNVPPVDLTGLEPARLEPADEQQQQQQQQWRSLTSRLADLASNQHVRRLDDERVQRWQLLLSALSISMALIFFGTPTRRGR